MSDYERVKTSIPELIDSLNRVGTTYSYETKYIGQAMSYLNLLYDILDKKLDSKEYPLIDNEEIK